LSEEEERPKVTRSRVQSKQEEKKLETITKAPRRQTLDVVPEKDAEAPKDTDEPGWKSIKLKDIGIVLRCRKCQSEVISKRSRDMKLRIGESVFKFCEKCQVSAHHDVVGYSAQMKVMEE